MRRKQVLLNLSTSRMRSAPNAGVQLPRKVVELSEVSF